MSQSYGIPGKTKASKNRVINLFERLSTNDCPHCDDDHGVICRHEVPLLGKSLHAHGADVDQQVDALRLSYRVLKVGLTSNTRAELNDYSEVYNEPLPWPETNEKRHHCANSDDAA